MTWWEWVLLIAGGVYVTWVFVWLVIIGLIFSAARKSF